MAVDLLPKVCIEIVIKDNDVEVVLETIEKAAKTGKIGDGRVFVMPVDISLRVRTGERESL
jgi:nitrogen regulatory protein P-II 1